MIKFIKRFIYPFRRLLALIIVIILGLLCFDKLSGEVMRYIYPKHYYQYVEKYCDEYGVEADFIYALIKCESNFNEEAQSGANAKGLMQLTDETFSYISERVTGEPISTERIFEPDLNIRFGVWYISYLEEMFEGKEELIIAAYNAGPSRVKEWLRDPQYSTDGENITTYPYRETESHVNKVKKAKTFYIKLYQGEDENE